MGRATLSKAGWKQGKQQLLGLFLSSHCPLCQRATPSLMCPNCQRQVRQCQLANPLDQTHSGLPVVSWGRYDGSLRQAIRSLKYSGQPGLAEFLGAELGLVWQQYQASLGLTSKRPIVMVPIPLHSTKLEQRGFNQAELLARWVGRVTRRPLNSKGLIRLQATQAQHGLSRQDRQANLAQAFALDPGQVSALRAASVWLVDDIFTTGATAQAAAQTLRRSGISVAGICTVARALAWEKP